MRGTGTVADTRSMTTTRPTGSSHRTITRTLAGLACAVAGALALPGLAHAATRDIKATVTNASDTALELSFQSLPAGCWGAGSPPATIEVDATVVIASESCGFATGTEFAVKYRARGGGEVLRLRYNNPFGGSDDFEETTASDSGFVTQSGGVIEDRSVRFACDAATCDGIPDAWKRDGVTIDPEGPTGPQFVDLPKMGVELDRPNVFVQLDWIQGNRADGTARDMRLQQAAIDRVVRAFDQVPRTYRGATRPGINLVVDQGPDSTIEPGGAKWGPLSRAGALPYSEGLLTGWRDPGYDLKNFYDLVRSRTASAGRLPIFSYATSLDLIVPRRKDKDGNDEFDDTSGYGVGHGFIVSLGRWAGGTGGTLDEQTGTFMHELGHTLGLSHGGQDDDNFKPNYPSVMNYSFQTNGVPRGGASVWDYSRIDTPDFDETAATEAAGVSLGPDGAGTGTARRCPNMADIVTIPSATLAPIDWSCGPGGTGTGFDVNRDDKQSTLKGSTADWSRVRFRRGGVGGGMNPEAGIPAGNVQTPSVDELTVAEAENIQPLDTKAPSTTLQRSPQPNADGWNNGQVTLTFSATDDVSGVARTEVAVDLGDFQIVTGPVTISDEGSHTVRYRSVDLAGNVEAATIVQVRIDRTKPATTGTLAPSPNAAGWTNGPTTVTVKATDALSGVRSTTIASAGAVTTAARTTAGDGESLLVDRDGVTVVRHHATDRADNVSDDVDTTVKTDATPPSSTVYQRDKGATVIHRDESVRGTATDATSGVSVLRVTYTPEFQAKGVGPVTVTGVLVCGAERLTCTWTAARPPHPGPWTVKAVATDVADNTQPTASTGRVVITG